MTQFQYRTVWLSVLLIAIVALSACGSSYSFTGTELLPAKPAPDFTLVDHNGQLFQLSTQRGKITVLFFGFTSCPNICPTALANLAAVRREIGSSAADVQVAMITVDPERDTPEALRSYVTKFDPTFIGLTGTETELKPIWKAYGVTRIDNHAADVQHNSMVTHSGYLYVIDQAGRWRLVLSTDDPVPAVANDLRQLIRAG